MWNKYSLDHEKWPDITSFFTIKIKLNWIELVILWVLNTYHRYMIWPFV